MSTLYANFHHDRHRQAAGQPIQPEKNHVRYRCTLPKRSMQNTTRSSQQTTMQRPARTQTCVMLPAALPCCLSPTMPKKLWVPQMPTGQHGLKSANPGELGAHSNVQIPQPARWRYSVRACAWGLLKCSQGTAPLNNSVNGFPQLLRRAAGPRADNTLSEVTDSTNRNTRVLRSRAQKVDNAKGGYEVTLVVHDGVKVRAMAMRVIERYSTWHITTVEYR